MSINLVCFSGYLTTKPELKAVKESKEVVEFSIAIHDGYGEKQKTFFPQFVAWNSVAKFIASYANKGDFVVIHGKYVEKMWEKDNKKLKNIVFIVKDLELRKKQTDRITNEDKGGEAYLAEGAFPEAYELESEIIE